MPFLGQLILIWQYTMLITIHSIFFLLQNHYFNDYIIFHHTILSFILPVQNYWAFPVPSHARMLSCAWLFAIWRTVTQEPPLAMEFSKQEHCSGLLFPSPGDLSHPGIEPPSPASSALAGGFFTTELPRKAHWASTFFQLFCIFNAEKSPCNISLSISINIFLV